MELAAPIAKNRTEIDANTWFAPNSNAGPTAGSIYAQLADAFEQTPYDAGGLLVAAGHGVSALGRTGRLALSGMPGDDMIDTYSQLSEMQAMQRDLQSRIDGMDWNTPYNPADVARFTGAYDAQGLRIDAFGRTTVSRIEPIDSAPYEQTNEILASDAFGYIRPTSWKDQVREHPLYRATPRRQNSCRRDR